MSTFEDHLWSQLVSDHGDRIRQAEKATASLATSSGGPRARGSRRWLPFAAALLVGCVASAIIVSQAATPNPLPPISRAAFTVSDNHDGTLTVTLHESTALPALNKSLARYGLKAKLPGTRTRTLAALVATCPKGRALPGKPHPLALAVGSPHVPLPGPSHRPLEELHSAHQLSRGPAPSRKRA